MKWLCNWKCSSKAKNFDVAERLQTHPSLLSRTCNRLKLDALKKSNLSSLNDAVLQVKIVLLRWLFFEPNDLFVCY